MQQKSCWLPDGGYELQLPYHNPTELTMDILRHAESVALVGDKTLVAAVGERLARAAALYGRK